jgi:hypothetical protein
MAHQQKLTEVVPNPHVALNNARNLRSIFPRGSKAFFQANETHTDTQIPHTQPKRIKAPALDKMAKREKESVGRIALRYRLFRVRPLDFENFAGSTKDCTDGLCRCGLLPGDDPTKVSISVEQERVEHYSDERTEIEIEWPDV